MRTIWIAFVCLLLSTVAAAAADAVPARLERMQGLVAAAAWKPLTPGIERLEVAQSGLLALQAYKISQDAFEMRVLDQARPTGSAADEVGKKAGATLVINGGFYDYGPGRSLVPIGMLVVGGKTLKKRARCGVCSGVLHATPKGADIVLATRIDTVKGVTSALQAGPTLVHPGGGIGIRSAKGPAAERSAVCMRGRDILVFAVLSPLTLYETAKLLQAPEDKGGFGCRVAINLDGGTSTQVYSAIEGHAGTIGFPRPVQNFVGFFPKRR